MSGKNIVWDVSKALEELPHKDLIETFVEKYIFEQKQISLQPNPFLLKYQIRKGDFLPDEHGKIDNPSFEKINLYSKGGRLFKEEYGFIRFYDVAMQGIPRAQDGLGTDEIKIGKIEMYQIFSDDALKELKKESACFVPVKDYERFVYRDKNSTRRVHLIFDHDLGYNDAEPFASFFPTDKQIFIPDGNILLVK